MLKPKRPELPPFVRTAAVLEPIARPLGKALGRGVCSECREVRPLISKGKRALCRECAGGVE